MGTCTRGAVAFGAWLCAAAALGQFESLPPQESRQAAVDELKKLGGTRLAEGFKASWCPDGSRLMCARMPVGSGLRVVDVNTGAASDGIDSAKDPAWSPKDPEVIAFVRGNGLDEEVWLVGPSGDKPRKVLPGGYPSWSVDGKTLFVHDRRSNRMTAVQIRDGQQTGVARIGVVVPWWYPEVSPSGKQFAYRTGNWLLVTDWEEARTVRAWPLPGGGGLLTGWSRDGNRLAFGGWGTWDPVNFQIVDLRTGRSAQLPVAGPTTPAWSPDGSKLALDLRTNQGWEVWTLGNAALEKLKWTDAPRDRYTVPEGGVAELVKFLEEQATFRPETVQEAIEHQHKTHEAMQQAALRILKIEKDSKSEAHRAASLVVLGNRARVIAQLAPARQRQTVAALKRYLAEQDDTDVRMAVAQLAITAAQALESSGQRDLAIEANRAFAEVLSKSEDGGLQRIAREMESAAKRLRSSPVAPE